QPAASSRGTAPVDNSLPIWPTGRNPIPGPTPTTTASPTLAPTTAPNTTAPTTAPPPSQRTSRTRAHAAAPAPGARRPFIPNNHWNETAGGNTVITACDYNNWHLVSDAPNH